MEWTRAAVGLLSAAGSDVGAAQTAAAIERLAIGVSSRVAPLPVLQALPAPAGPTVQFLLQSASQHHADHLAAFNAAAVRLGGQPQPAADATVATTIVQPALAGATTPGDLLAVLARIEQIAAETYAVQVAAVTDAQLRASFATITGVEAQHAAVLLAAAALIDESKDALLTLPWPAAALPATAATTANPAAFLKTDQARPAAEGALR